MKKTIITAMGIMCLGVGIVKASATEVNFDGNSAPGITNSLEAIKSAVSSQDNETIVPAPEPVVMPFRMFHSGMVNYSGSATLSEGANYDLVIVDNITFLEQAGRPMLTNCLKQLLKYGTTAEKKEYVLGKVYKFPKKFLVASAGLPSRSGDWTYGPEYIESVTETREISAKEICVYVTTRFCRLACRLMTDPPQTEECIKECYDILVKTCDKFDDPAAPKK